MNKILKKNGTLYSMITGNYVLFAVIVILIALLSITILNRGIDNAISLYGANGIISQEKLLKEENYDKIIISRKLGKGTYIEVLDENANIVYTGNESKNNTYTLEEVDFIPDVFGNTYYTMDTLYKENALEGYVIHRYNYDDTVDDAYMILEGIIILDADRNIVYSNLDTDAETITEKKIDYLYGYDDDDETYVQKYEFVTNKGEKRILLIHSVFSSAYESSAYKEIFILAVTVFIVLLVMLIIFFVFRVSFVVKKPLNMLKKAMASYTTDSSFSEISYTGPKEFVEIIGTFNKMSKRLNDSEKKRLQSENEKQKMLADISHDLKTPITVIQGYSKAVSEGLVPKEEEKRYLETINKKAENLSELINTFYEYSRLEHPEFSLIRENEDLCEYLREYLAAKYEELNLMGFNMDIDLPDDRIEYSFDTVQLKRVFENIISNSVKANPKGTTIIASMKEYEDKIIIHIGDDGVGIPENIRENIFNPFVVGNESRTSGQGTGLGLAIAKLIVETHGGSIKLLEEKPDGPRTVFEIVFPK
ncbi:MAG: HAMP domain-containing histidine kinase [Butyrivibrio sp.]|nr:HAMP domain-containing histidine kinase [Butyrivibrio sp.]